MNNSQFGGGGRKMAFLCRRRCALPPIKIHIMKLSVSRKEIQMLDSSKECHMYPMVIS